MALTSGTLEQFERYCEQLYTSPDAGVRATAEAALVQLTTSAEYIPQCQQVLEQSSVAYAQLIAANALKRLVQQSWNQLSPADRVEQRNFVLNFLAAKGPACAPFVTVSLGQLVAVVTKLGWFDGAEHQQILPEVSKFLQERPEYVVLGLLLLEHLVCTMNASSNVRSLTQHRKVAGSFRDTCLLDIMQLALHTLRQAHASARSAPSAEQERIRERALALVRECLSYDFIGTSLDEAAEELGTIQAPTSWRSAMEDPATLSLFFDVQLSSPPAAAAAALEAIVLLASLRRSLFSSDDERQAFLVRLLGGTLNILKVQSGLSDEKCYHEVCRLLARLKANFQLSELVQAEDYPGWIAAVAAFTVDSFKHWQWATNSVFYLLSLWSRLVASMPYLKGDTPSQLEQYVPQVITAFISSRMELVRALVNPTDESADLDDPFDDEEQLMEQLETLPCLCRFQLQQVRTPLARRWRRGGDGARSPRSSGSNEHAHAFEQAPGAGGRQGGICNSEAPRGS